MPTGKAVVDKLHIRKDRVWVWDMF